MTSPRRVSSPAARMLLPAEGTFFSSNSLPQPEVFSTITTASAPAGITPPVKILMASPSPQRVAVHRRVFEGRRVGRRREIPRQHEAQGPTQRRLFGREPGRALEHEPLGLGVLDQLLEKLHHITSTRAFLAADTLPHDG